MSELLERNHISEINLIRLFKLTNGYTLPKSSWRPEIHGPKTDWTCYERTVTVLFLHFILFLEVIYEMSLIAMAFYFEVFGPDFVIMIIRNEARYFSSRRNSISFHYLCMKVSLFSCKPVMNSQSEKLY